MKVKDLVKSLSKVNQELEVFCLLDDSSKILEIENVTETDGLVKRIDGIPMISSSETSTSKYAILEITSDI
jgi:hypothetical protein